MIISAKRKVLQSIHVGNITETDYIKYLVVYKLTMLKIKLRKILELIINKLRNYLDIEMRKQLYYALVYPCINYGLISWGNTYTSKLQKIRIGQNKCIRNIFFANKRESATPYFNLLRILKFDNMFINENVNLNIKLSMKS